MTTIGYFLRTPSAYRRQAFFVCSSLITLIVLPIILALAPVSADVSFGSIAYAEAPSEGDSDGTNHLAAPAPSVNDIATATASTTAASRVWPARGVVTLEFGAPDWPYEAHHTGIDIAGSSGQAIHPFMAGTVSQVLSNASCGHCVYVNHGNGVVSHYSHMSGTNALVGETVTTNSIIGYEGATGWATGPHVHFEVELNGAAVNPRNFVSGNPPR